MTWLDLRPGRTAESISLRTAARSARRTVIPAPNDQCPKTTWVVRCRHWRRQGLHRNSLVLAYLNHVMGNRRESELMIAVDETYPPQCAHTWNALAEIGIQSLFGSGATLPEMAFAMYPSCGSCSADSCNRNSGVHASALGEDHMALEGSGRSELHIRTFQIPIPTRSYRPRSFGSSWAANRLLKVVTLAWLHDEGCRERLRERA